MAISVLDTKMRGVGLNSTLIGIWKGESWMALLVLTKNSMLEISLFQSARE